MSHENCKKMISNTAKHIGKKVFESAVNAAVFAFVSNKVSDFLDRQKEQKKVRVEQPTTSTDTTNTCC